MRSAAMTNRLALAMCVAGLAAGSASAHHSYAMFDRDKTVTLEGTVSQFQWTNPHVFVQVLVPDASGKAVEWSIEGAGPSLMMRSGWTHSALKVGDKVKVSIHPLRSGEPGGGLLGVWVGGKQIGNQGGPKS